MCGICGITGPTVSNKEAVNKMLVSLKHRGPDDQGIFEDTNIVLGSVRLAIIDTSPAGHQPMSTDDKLIWIVYNGEIYNFKEERIILEQLGYKLKSQSDTEVALAMYQTYGHTFVNRLRGMFALAIYDKRQGIGKEKLLLARDPFGIKPLLYAQLGKELIFASEIKSILASGLVNKELDTMALMQLLAYGSVPQPLTIVAGVQMLLPGHLLIWEGNRAYIQKYWKFDINRATDLQKKPYEELVKLVRKKLEEVVAQQMVSDVPLGAFLSGGIDSAVLVALMAKVVPGKLKTFSVGFGKEGSFIDETSQAQKIADYIGTNHTRILITGDDLKRQISSIIRGLDQPSVDGVNAYFISQAARRDVTVSLSGLGGDELFAGYSWFINITNYVNANKRPLVRWIYQFIAKLANLSALNYLPTSKLSRLISKLRGLQSFLHKFSREYQVFGPEGAWLIIAPKLRRQMEARSSLPQNISTADELSTGSVIQRISALILRTYTQNQLLRDTDATSMSHSLEVRVPYLDPELVNLVLSLPDSTKLHSHHYYSSKADYQTSGAKRILIDAVRDLLPAGIDQQSKQGFGLPMANWLKGPLRDLMNETLSPTVVNRRGLFQSNRVSQLKKSFLANQVHWSTIWLLIVIELWCREFIDLA